MARGTSEATTYKQRVNAGVIIRFQPVRMSGPKMPVYVCVPAPDSTLSEVRKEINVDALRLGLFPSSEDCVIGWRQNALSYPLRFLLSQFGPIFSLTTASP